MASPIFHQLVRDQPLWTRQPCIKALLTPIMKQRITFACAGIGCPERALAEKGISFIGKNVIEINPQLKEVLEGFHDPDDVHICDICVFDEQQLCDSEGYVAGPSCPPWSRGGLRNGVLDERSGVFEAVLKQIHYLAVDRDCLKWFVIENTSEIMNRRNGDAPFIKTVMKRLCVLLGKGWSIQPHIVQTSDYWLPQERKRVYIIGMHPLLAQFGGIQMPPVAPLGSKPSISEFLDCNWDVQLSMANRSPTQQNNIAVSSALLNSSGALHPISNRSLVIFDASRNHEAVWRIPLRVDVCPPLCTSNNPLYIYGPGAPDKVPLEGRGLSVDERARLCGVVPSSIAHLGKCQRVKALGNSMPVDTVGVVLAALHHHIALFERKVLYVPRFSVKRTWSQSFESQSDDDMEIGMVEGSSEEEASARSSGLDVVAQWLDSSRDV